MLTITKATSQARRHADRLMPGAGVTVESRGSFTPDLSTQLVITTVTFPENVRAANDLALRMQDLYNADVRLFPSRIVITREA